VGDKVLLEIAGKLQNTVRGRGFVSRLSGDEFTIILPNITGETLPDMMSELLTVLNGVLVIDYGKQIEYEVSIGAAIFPEHGRDEEQLVIHADMAMYYAKNKADEKWHIFDQKDDRLVQMRLEQELIKLMKKALAEDLFELVFQPAMSIKNARVNHYEALIRLNYKDGSQCPPSLFIPLAEKSSLISKIDDWVVETVYKKMQSWLVEQPDLSIGINISAPSLQGKDFYLNLTKLNEKYQIPPESITIELTETSYIDNFGNVHSNLDYLSEKGFAIALDDFGVGYSSFNYLRELPLNYVKLDGSYVNGVSRKSENVAFIKSVVIMAKEFNMETIAEYVETKEDLDVLRELGIDYAQGFLVGKPSEKLLTKQQVAKAQKFI
jgi:EAL domain-containing protein (putative c-di-GMP-specific phosphodiesterase class I)